ncbi:MAG: class I SAM-dependent methyltransferase [Bacteroidetes bacterium]|nr:class I SAM-dependent methyltransferase [Bacteroidota bacterium]
MYSRYRLAQKYVHYYLTAANGKGHGIHSPFVFDFVIRVLNDSAGVPAIEGLRRRLLVNRSLLEVEDLGAGSAFRAMRMRSVGDITKRAAKPAKLGMLLYRIAKHYGVSRVLELGTSMGLSTAYLAEGVKGAARARGEGAVSGGGAGGTAAPGGGGVVGGRVWSIEGAAQVAEKAEENLRWLGLENVRLVTGNFDTVLPEVLGEMGGVDLAFVDGNHRREPTLAYFDLLMGHVARPGILIFDDIHWSKEMEEAWAAIKSDSRVYLTVDLFFIGIVFLREEFKVKQDFVIRF